MDGWTEKVLRWGVGSVAAPPMTRRNARSQAGGEGNGDALGCGSGLFFCNGRLDDGMFMMARGSMRMRRSLTRPDEGSTQGSKGGRTPARGRCF